MNAAGPTDGLRTRLPLLDVAVATVLLVWAVLSEAQVASAATARPWDAVTAALWVAPLVLRTTAPFAMAVCAAAAEVGYALVPGAPDWAPFEASLLIAFTIGLHLSGRRRWTALLLYAGGTYATELATTPFHGFMDTYASVPLILGGAAGAGVLLRRARLRTAELRRLGQELVEERESRARDAAAAERNRIARELHDVISHSVSVMVVQAGAAEQQLPAGSPAREQLGAVRRTGKETLVELRRQLGVLREAGSWTET
jgi:signal transduction histidine kinase